MVINLLLWQLHQSRKRLPNYNFTSPWKRNQRWDYKPQIYKNINIPREDLFLILLLLDKREILARALILVLLDSTYFYLRSTAEKKRILSFWFFLWYLNWLICFLRALIQYSKFIGPTNNVTSVLQDICSHNGLIGTEIVPRIGHVEPINHSVIWCKVEAVRLIVVHNKTMTIVAVVGIQECNDFIEWLKPVAKFT